jgi:hypothetical protein
MRHEPLLIFFALLAVVLVLAVTVGVLYVVTGGCS